MSLQRPTHELVATVIGSGTMGAQIAAHLANAGIRTHLLDIVPEQVGSDAPRSARDALASGAIKALGKTKPPALMRPAAASRITPGNLDDDLERCVAESALVVEAVVERLDVKKPLFARIAAAAPATAILATNTSGLRIDQIAEDLPESARARVVGMHFFNPPRYMHLLEVVSSRYTDPAVADALSTFGRDTLGKGIVPCRDTPNFIGNRIGIADLMLTFEVAFAQGYTVEEVDVLNGPLMGRPKTGSFRLADLIGLDVAALVISNLAQATSADPTAADFDELHERMVVHPKLAAMVDKGMLGDKARQGFYKKTSEKGPSGRRAVLSLDLETLEYRPRIEPAFAELAGVAKLRPTPARVHAALRVEGRAGELLRAVYLPLFNYAAHRLGEVSDTPTEIDDAMRWGYGWELGPFALWDAIGVSWGVQWLREHGHEVAPAAVRLLEIQGDDARWFGGSLASPTVFDPGKGASVPLSVPEGVLRLAARHEAGAVLDHNDDASLVDLGEGIACLEFHSKMNSLGAGVVSMLASAVPTLEARGGFRGLVIGNQGAHFSAGADIMMILGAAKQSRWGEIEQAVHGLQQALLGLQHASVPVVTAPFGMALGGGCEVVLHGAASVADAESYLGLVEIGVGLLPAGGGLKEIARRASQWASQVPDGDPYPWVRRGFEATTTGKVSASAHDAIDLGYLRTTDTVVFHRDQVLARAKRKAIALAEAGWTPPDPDTPIKVVGASRGASFLMGAQLFVWGGFATEHDQHIASKIAHVLSGGMSATRTVVTAQDLLDLEREAFVSLCGEVKTQARLQHMLETGKPLRN